MLKNKQIGILSNLSLNVSSIFIQKNKKIENSQNKKQGNNNNKLSTSKVNNSISLSNKKTISQNQNNDATLTEIEKQINLLNSLNTNNNSR